MSKKISGCILFLMIAAFVCSCSPKGGTGTESQASEQGEKNENAGNVPSGEEVWNRTELQKPEGAVRISSLKYLTDGALRISVSDEDYQNEAVLDSKDDGGSWEDTDADMSLKVEDGSVGYHYSAEGDLYSYNTEKLVFSAGDGGETKTILAEENEFFYSVSVSADTLAVVIRNWENEQMRAEVCDLRTMEFRKLENQELSEFMDAAFEIAGGNIALNSTGTILYIEGAGIARYDLAGDEFGYVVGQDTYHELMNPNEENGLLNEVVILNSFVVNDKEDRVFLSIWSEMSDQTKLYLLEKGARREEKQEPKEKLRIYSLKQSSLRRAATLFQEQHPELEVTFETGYTGEDSVTLPDAVRTLNTELMAGEGPDLLVLDGLPVDSYIEKGMLEDLTDIVEPEKENYFYNIISACNGGGNIYQVPTSFTAPVILGDTDVMAAKNREELMAVLKQKAGTGIPFIPSETIADAALELFITSDIVGETIEEEKLADYYRDLETIAGLCFSDEERERLPYYDKMTYWTELYPDGVSEAELDIYFDKAQAGTGKIMNLDGYMKILPLCKEKGISYQHLNREGGNYFIPDSIMGINRNGKNPDAAEQFLRYYLSGESYGNGGLPDISIIRELLGGSRYVSEDGEYVGGTSNKYTPDEVMYLYKLTPDELEELIGFLEELDTPVKDDAVVLRKVMEQADACLFEGKDPESAARDACKEINLYLAEQ